MKYLKYSFIFIISGLILLTGCNLQEPEIRETTLSNNEKLLFSRLMAVGDNIVAGYQNAALTEKHQKRGFVALLAQQGQTPDFMQPLLGYPGLGSESYSGYGTLELRYLDNPNTPNTVNPDPQIYAVPFADYPDFDPVSMPYVSEEVMTYPLPYNNLGIPGIVMEDILSGKTKLKSKSHSGMIDLVLRNSANPLGELPAFQQAKLFVPSLMICWAGMYDVLGYAQYTGNAQIKLSAPTSAERFQEKYAALMDSLLSTNAVVVAGNVPDILDMPYFNLVPSVVIDTVTNAPYLNDQGNPVPLLGVEEGSRVLFPGKNAEKAGYGIPEGILNGNGQDIPADMVLDTSEIALVREAIENYNAIIDTVCSNRHIPVVDMYSMFKELKTGISESGMVFTDAYISGGFYSLDGIHPSDLGNALIANEWLRTINDSFRATIPYVNIPQLMSDLQPMNTDTLTTNQ